MEEEAILAEAAYQEDHHESRPASRRWLRCELASLEAMVEQCHLTRFELVLPRSPRLNGEEAVRRVDRLGRR